MRISQKPLATDPLRPSFQLDRSRDLILATSIFLRLGRTDEARAALEEAIPILTSLIKRRPDRPEYVAELAHGYLRKGQLRKAAGDTPGAVADWKRAIERYKTIHSLLSGPQTFQSACCHAALSGAATQPALASAEAEQAMELLKKATGMSYRSPDTFRTEPALDPLRNRDDFKKLMADLEQRAAKPL